MIHEATFEDTEEGQFNALAKRHSTAGEAVGMGSASGASHTLLTHFSARYPKLPVLKVDHGAEAEAVAEGGAMVVEGAASDAVEKEMEVQQAAGAGVDGKGKGKRSTLFVAYDLMRVKGSDLPHLPRLLPAMHALFKEEEREEEEKGAAAAEGQGVA